ncbi:MAG: histidinol-phosphate transaminase [Bacteroidaceae bacterium]|nr:histidinol-phosphate transaminase [Bacteroidaceae bacterium]
MTYTQKDIYRFVRPNIMRLKPYSCARDEYTGHDGVFIDANENPFRNGFNRYPDPRQMELKRRLSEVKNVPVGRIFIGNGSDEAIDLCFRIFCVPGTDNVISIAPSYGMYQVSADINDVEVREVRLNDDFSLPLASLLSAADDRSRLMFLCSPNNPTGNSFAQEDILLLAERFDGIIVVDEAYIDFSDHDSLLSRDELPGNIIVLQTLSKAYGMAGLRLGLAFACENIIDLFSKVKYPYNINQAGMNEAFSLLGRDVGKEVAEIRSERLRVAEALRTKPNVRKVYPSDANFLLVEVDDADGTYERLVRRKVIVRNRNNVAGCEGCLRITIGTKAENNILLSSISEDDE